MASKPTWKQLACACPTRNVSKQATEQLPTKHQKIIFKNYAGLLQFAAMIGSDGTCLLLSYHAPTDSCPPMDDDCVALYRLYKTQPKGKHLRRKDRTMSEVLNVSEELVLCTGDWKAPVNCEQFLSSVTLIHHSINQKNRVLAIL
jgi:hypothetical protein